MKVDFAIITMRPEEQEAIHIRFTPQPYTDPSSQQTYGISQVQTRGGKNCTAAIASPIRRGNDASQQLASRMISDLDPQMLLVVGIGGGVPDNDFTLGDVIVSSYIHNFDVNAIKGNETSDDVTGGIHPAISNITANLRLYQDSLADWNSESSIRMVRPSLYLTEKRLKDLIDKDVDEAWREKVAKALKWHFDKAQRGARAPKVLPGTIASSNTLVRSDPVLVRWLQGARSIWAVEMEAAGVYQATQLIRQQYPVMAIRGISDIIGFKRDDNWKLYACHTAAAFAHAFIAAGIVEPRENMTSSSDRPSAAVPNLPPIQHSLDANTIKIFTIYADADKLHKERLETQLSPYVWSGMMDLWDRNRITPGAALIQQEIDKHIDSSQVILLLISPNFPASKQCLSEMARATQRRTNSEAIIIPIYIRPTDWPEAPFEGLLALPRSGEPVNSWSKVDEAWYDVAVDIRKACEGLRKSQSNPSHSHTTINPGTISSHDILTLAFAYHTEIQAEQSRLVGVAELFNNDDIWSDECERAADSLLEISKPVKKLRKLLDELEPSQLTETVVELHFALMTPLLDSEDLLNELVSDITAFSKVCQEGARDTMLRKERIQEKLASLQEHIDEIDTCVGSFKKKIAGAL